MDKINVVITNMSVDEAVTMNEDNSYTVFISDSLSPEYKQKAYIHALTHICNCDFENNKSVQDIEMIAHNTVI